QAEHDRGLRVPAPDVSQRGAQLTVDAIGVAVHDDQVRGEPAHHSLEHAAADVDEVGHRHLDVTGAVAGTRLPHAGQHDHVEAVREVEGGPVPDPGDQHAGDGATGPGRQLVGQRVREGEVASGVPQADGVMGVEQNPERVVRHGA